MKKLRLSFILIVFLCKITLSQKMDHDSLPYLGEKLPGLSPKIFAPGIISKQDEYEFGSALTKSADRFYYAVRLNEEWKAEIRYTEFKNGQWTNPQRMALNPRYSYNDPFITKDEDRLYFISDRPLNGKDKPKDIDLWYIQKTSNGWSDPIHAGITINSPKDEFYISISESGNIYYASNIHTGKEDKWDFDIYYAMAKNDSFSKPVRLDSAINSPHFE